MAKKKRPPEPEPPLRLEWRSPAELAENPANWRRHPEAQTAALADVISEVGWAGACLYNRRTKRLIDGHARRKVAIEQGCERVPVLVGDWSEEQERKILATLDPLSAMAERDEEALKQLLEGVSTDSDAVQALLDSLAGVSVLDSADPSGGGDDFDATPEPAGPTRTAAGELWLIGGAHRLLVGDCTVRENVERLMDGERAALCLTDPPYANRTGYASHNDTVAALDALVATSLPLARACCERLLLTAGVANLHRYPPPDWVLCWFWSAGAGSGPWGFCCWQPVLAYGDDPYLKAGLGRRPDGFSLMGEAEDNGHPCPKPLKVWSWLLERGSLNEGDLVYDPFLGSGTTLVAAHRLGRVCYGCEIEPRYADVVLKRAEAEWLSCERL